jgi:hypothetical protein
MSAVTCPHCDICLSAQEKKDGKCESCNKALPRSMRSRARTRIPEATTAATTSDVRPWTPFQIMAASFVFGSAACGVITGINFARLGKSASLAPSVLAGIVVFVFQAAFILFAVPEQGTTMAFTLSNVVIGLGFMLAQKPDFDRWKEDNWSGDSYQPNGAAQLLLVGFACAAFQFVIAGAMLMLAQG